MNLDFCAVCGSRDDLHHHHFTPKLLGGSDKDTNMLTLCYEHHCEIHGKSYRDRIHHRELTRKGMQKAREMGVKFGNPNLADVNRTRVRKAHKYAWEHKDLLLSLKDSGMSLMQMCDILMNKNIKTRSGFRNWNPTQVRRMLKRIENGLVSNDNHE